MNWPDIKLGECCEVVSGGTPSRGVNEYWHGTIPWITPKDLTALPDKFLPTAPEFITEEGLKNSSATMLPTGSVLLSSRAPIGHLAINLVPVCTNQGFKNLVPKSNLNPDYLYYCLKANKRQLQDIGVGATFKEISKTKVEAFKIPLPPLETQKKIALVLDKADRIRQKRKQALKRLDDLIQSVFLDMFGDPVTNPMGWEKVRLDEVTSIQTGSTPSRTNPDYYSGSMPWVKTTEIRGNEIFEAEESITEAGLRESNCKLFPRDTILVAMYGQGITRGRTGILKIPACTNQACAAILPCVAILPQFLFTYLKNQYEEIRRLGRGGNQPNLNLNMIKKFTILLPPIEIQENFVNQAAIIKKILEKGTISDRKSTNFFNSLLQRAFKGELSFNNNYIDQLLACDSENKTISSEIGTKLCRLI